MDESNASIAKDASILSSPAKDQSTGPFTPRKSGDKASPSSDLVLSLSLSPEQKAKEQVKRTDLEEEVKTPKTKTRGRSLAPSSAFREPGEPLSARVLRTRRKTQYCTPSKTPEQM